MRMREVQVRSYVKRAYKEKISVKRYHMFSPLPVNLFFKNKMSHVLLDFAPGRHFNSLVKVISSCKAITVI